MEVEYYSGVNQNIIMEQHERWLCGSAAMVPRYSFTDGESASAKISAGGGSYLGTYYFA
jgi:hypothetical protein